MSFQQGLSGLNLSSRALDVVGNNIANSQTVGFKTSVAQFNDVYAAALGGAVSSNSIGQGGAVMAVAQTFTQGNVTNTNNPLDIAINGDGFLVFQPSLNDETPMYSRNGQLHLDADGYLVNGQNMVLNAFLSPDGENIDQSSSQPIQMSNAPLQPRPTGFVNTISPGTGGIDLGLNLDVRDMRANTTALVPAAVPASGWTALDAWDFATINPNMYNYSTSSTVYDQRGEPHILTTYFVRQATLDGSGAAIGSSRWAPHFVLDSQYELTSFNTNATVPLGPLSTIDFNPNGTIDTNTNGPVYTIDMTVTQVVDPTTVPPTVKAGPDLTALPLALFPDAATEPNYAMTVDFSTATQFGSNYDVNKLTQDGFGPGRLSGVAIDSDGMILARYSNGQSKLIGQIALSTFQNPQGLVPLGNNMWAESAASGQPLIGTPQSGSRGTIQASAVEDANVDLTQELVSMITLQRAYQANAQTIKTQDQILQTLVNLR